MVDLARLKLCRHCRERKPLREFDYPRHRICSACRQARITAVVTDNPTAWQQAQWFFNAQNNAPLDAGLTTNAFGRAAYQRQRYRKLAALKRIAADQRQSRMSMQPAPAAFDPHRTRRCRHCKRMLHVLAFDNPHVRICKSCDGPQFFGLEGVKPITPREGK